MLASGKMGSIGILTLLLLSSCGKKEPLPLNPSTETNPKQTFSLRGTYRLKKVECAGMESQTYTSSSLATLLTVLVTYQGDHAQRRTTLGGCTQVIPMSSITYHGDQSMTVTEQQSYCEEVTPGDCSQFSSLCHTPPVTDIFPINENGQTLLVQIPPSSNVQTNPCQGQSTNPIIFRFEKQ